LYFLGYTKQDINKHNTNILNWKKVKTLLTEKDFFSKIKAYDYRGPKGAVKSYALINRLQDKLTDPDKEGVKQEVLDEYNLGFGRIFYWFKSVLDVRIKDIKWRRT